MLKNHRISPIIYLISFLICAIVYLPGLNGGFFLDDHPNITMNPALQIDSLTMNNLKRTVLTSRESSFQRNVSMISFAFNYYIAGGFSTYSFKLFNLILHLLNGILLLTLLRLLSKGVSSARKTPQINHWIICAIVFTWLISPLNVSTVLYVVQRMAMLSAFFVLSGMIFYIKFRIAFNEKKNHQTILYMVLFVISIILAVLSKENGLLLPYFALLIEIAFFRFSTSSAKQRKWLISCAVTFVGLSLIAVFGILIFSPETVLSGYETRSFTLSERLLTESRVLWWYIQNIIFPINTNLGLFHDDFTLSTSLFDPLTTLFSIIGLLVLLIAGMVSFRKYPYIGFGLLFFFLGHSLESTVIPLEIMFEHRNYLPGIGILIALYFGVESTIKQSRLKYANLAVLLLYSVFLTASAAVRINTWKDNLTLATAQVLNHPQSARSHSMLGATFLNIAKKITDPEGKEQINAKGKKHLLIAEKLDPNATSAYFNLIQLAYIEDQYVDEEQVRLLENILKTEKYDASAVNHLNSIVKQAKSSDYGLPKEVIMRLLHALEQNQNYAGKARAELYTLISTYLLLVVHDYEYAVYYIAQAAEYIPKNPKYRVHLANTLRALGRKNDACEELKTAISIDTLHTESERVNALLRQLKTCDLNNLKTN